MSVKKDKSYIVAIDAGGTMTDAVIVDSNGDFEIGKYRTFRADESESYMGSVKAVTDKMGTTTSNVHANCDVSIYAGTAMTNTLITLDGNKVGLIITRGMEHMSIIENGLAYIGQSQKEILHQQLRRHTAPLIDNENIFGVSERVTGGSYFGEAHMAEGEVLIPINLTEVELAAERLVENGVDVIGILFLNAHVFSNHEEQAAKVVRNIVKKHKKDIKVIMSHEIAPIGKDAFRLKSLLVQCFAAEKVRKQLEYVEAAAKKDGYKNELLTLLSFGGAVSIKYPRLYETIVSGPIGGLTTGKEIAKLLDINKLAIGDVGGTSYDVGTILNKRIELRPDSDFAKHRLALSMVELDSIALGMGTEVKVNDFGSLDIGPESAGYLVGTCLDYDKLTITDIQVALGYIGPDSFLGGKIILDRDKACAAVESAGKQLGIKDLYEAGEGFLNVFFTNLREFTRTAIEAKGFRLGDFTLLAGGGGGLVNMHGLAKGGIFKDVVTTPFGSTLSAFGVGCADLVHRYNQGVVAFVKPGSTESDKVAVLDTLKKEWAVLQKKAVAEFKLEAVKEEDIKYSFGVFMRYIGQLESFETKLSIDMDTPGAMDKITAAFDAGYEEKFPAAAKFDEAGYAITQVFIEAVGPKVMPKIKEYELDGIQVSDNAYAGSRQVYHNKKFVDFRLYQLEELKAGNVVSGPAVIFDDISTLVVAEGDTITFDKYRIMHYRAD